MKITGNVVMSFLSSTPMKIKITDSQKKTTKVDTADLIF